MHAYWRTGAPVRGIKLWAPCRLPGERADVWMVRYHGLRPSLFWGLRQLTRREAAQIAAGAKLVLFLGGHLRGRYEAAVAEALERYPFVPREKAVQACLSPARYPMLPQLCIGAGRSQAAGRPHAFPHPGFRTACCQIPAPCVNLCAMQSHVF